MKVPVQDMRDKDTHSKCTSCAGRITEMSEEVVEEPATSQRLKGVNGISGMDHLLVLVM